MDAISCAAAWSTAQLVCGWFLSQDRSREQERQKKPISNVEVASCGVVYLKVRMCKRAFFAIMQQVDA